jgi:hypothetical protein
MSIIYLFVCGIVRSVPIVSEWLGQLDNKYYHSKVPEYIDYSVKYNK